MRICLFVAILLLSPTLLFAASLPPAQLIGQAMDSVLLETGNPFIKVIKQGSWISGVKYRDPLKNLVDASDHDARLFIPLENVSPERAKDAWKSFQGRLRRKIKALAETAGYNTDEIQRLLRSVNLYPPSQMLQNVAKNEDAIAEFLKSGNYPNLLEVGEEGAEGLYTTPTKFILQAYEKGERVQVAELVADEGGEAYSVVHSATAVEEHAIEGIAQPTLEGYVQAAEYSLNEAQQALREGKLALAKKNVTRARKYYMEARKLSGVSAEGVVAKELGLLEDAIAVTAENAFISPTTPKALAEKSMEFSQRIGKDVLKKANVEFAALETLAVKNSVKQRAFLKGVLEGEGKWAGLRLKLEEASESAIATLKGGAKVAYKNWFVGLLALWELKELPEAIEKEGLEKASIRLAATIAGLANPGFGLLQLFSAIYMGTGELLVDWISSAGYGAVVQRQDCMDLIAGIYTVPGREQNIEDKTCEQMQSDRQLACRVYDQHGLRKHLASGYAFRQDLIPPYMMSLLACHAKAASRHYDDVESKHDQGVEQALMSKCSTPVLKAWLDARQLVINEVDVLRQNIEERGVDVIASPARLKEKGSVSVAVRDSLDHAAVEKDIKERAACMGGINARPAFSRNHVWMLNGREFDKTYDRGSSSAQLAAPGNYEVCVEIRYEWRVDGLPKVSMEDGLSGKAVRRGCTTVAVDETPRESTSLGDTPSPVVPITVGKKQDIVKEPLVCSYEYSDWGECGRTTKKQTRSVTARKPSGCIEKQKPSLEQTCTPPPSEEDKKNQYLNCLCRCYCGWAGHIGVWYDPENKSVPECKSSGPCFGGAGAFGCTSRHFFGAPNDCAKGCWEGAFGKGTYDPKKADDMRRNENKKHKQPLKVKLTPSKNPADFGDIVTLQAEASEGTGGYSYVWSGCAQDAKDAQAKVVNTNACKSCAAGVTITDQDGESASASVTIQCNSVKVKLTKESPKENRIPIGGKATFFAEVFSGDKPFSGPTLFYVWERNPDAVFGDPKNPAYETSAGSQTRNSATFRKIGTTPVWVKVLREMDGRKVTIGESEQIPVEVVKPTLKLTADKKDPLVGELVTVSVQEEPRMSDEMLSFWWELSGDAVSAGPAANVPNGRAYSLKTKNDKPITVTVHAKAKDGGDELGVEKITFSAKKPAVNITGPKIAGPPPVIWREGVGLVPAERQIAEGQRVEFSAAVTPDAQQEFRYQWTVAPEGCSLAAPASRETGVTCSKTGGYTMTCAVKNADGADLGSGSGTLSVTVSQSDIDKGKQKDEAIKKLNKAKDLWSQRKYDEAVAEAEAASKIDAQLAAPLLTQFSQELKKQGWDALHKSDHPTAIRRLEQAVRLNPADADAKKKLEDAKNYAAQWPRVEAKARAFDGFIAQQKVWSANRTMLEIQDILRPMAAGQSTENPLWKRVSDEMTKGLAWYNDFSQKSNAEWTRLFKEQQWEQAETHLKQVLKNELSPADQKHFESALQTTNTMLGQRREAMQYYDQAKANYARGIPSDANGLADVAKQLRNYGARFLEKDSRRNQFTELAAGMEKAQKKLHAKAYAQSAFNNGDQYYRAYNFEAAVGQYAEGLKAMRENGDPADPLYAKYYKQWEDSAAKDKRFKELYGYAASLAVTDNPLDEATLQKGIGAAEDALKLKPRDTNTEIHWNKLKWKLGELQRTKSQQQQKAQACEAKWTEGRALFDSGRHSEALMKLKE
ncbi:MAG TPA: hypothetical protein VK445_01765, partial [Dissulfurispiraceae bacterium]|nr:hypothetical protein [Dissulfurispiraceae bacterium]